MLADGRTVPDSEVVMADVCVVGSGPAGVTLAKELTDAGLQVILLERGSLRRDGIPEGVQTAVNTGIPYPVNDSRSFEFGGATYTWRVTTPLGSGFGRFRELDSSDFSQRPWISQSGWPFGRDHLNPFYERAHALFDLPWTDGFANGSWEDELIQSPFSEHVDDLRTRPFYFVSPGLFAGELLRRLENSQSAIVLSNSVVTDIRTDDYDSTVSSLIVSTGPTHGYRVEAKIYVLAAGGIENPRLLLASTSRQPRGIGNEHDLVGRFFMEHPHYASGRLIPTSPSAFSQSNNYEIHLHRGVPVQKKYGLSDEVTEREGIARCVFRLEAKPKNESIYTLRYGESAIRAIEAAGSLRRHISEANWAAAISGPLRSVVAGAHHLSRFGFDRARVRLARKLTVSGYTQPFLFWIRAMAEQVPDRNSRVFLRSEKDALGVPIAELHWQLNDQDLRTIRRSQELLGNAWQESGIGMVESLVAKRPMPPALSGGKHHIGTTRMSDSPRHGVVDGDCQVHGMKNLFVAGSSVFPTSGYANPTLTILALAYRLGDYVIGTLRGHHHDLARRESS